MKTLLLVAIAFSLMLGLYSCKCDGCNYYDHRCEVKFKNFADSLVTTVTLKRYAKNTGFLQPLDSSVNNTEAVQEIAPGTNQFEYAGRQLTFTADDVSDYGITLPNGEEFKISDLVFEARQCRVCAKNYYPFSLSGYKYAGAQYSAAVIEIYR